MNWGTILTRYDFLEARRVILINVRTDYNLISILVNLLDELGQIMTGLMYDFVEATRVILTYFYFWSKYDFG